MPVSRVIAETNRRHPASNKLARRTSKKVAGACERWPSWSLFSGATRGEGPAKRCPDAPLRGEQCPGVSRGSGSVLQALAGGWLIARWVGRVPRASSLSRDGADDDGSIRRVPVRGRCLGSLQGVSFSRGGVGGGLGRLPRFRAAQPPPNGAWCSVGLAKAGPPRAAGGRRQGHQRFDRAVAVGRRRPRLAAPVSPGPRGSTLQHRSTEAFIVAWNHDLPRVLARGVASCPRARPIEIPRAHEMRVFVSTVRMAEVGPWHPGRKRPPRKRLETSLSSPKEASPRHWRGGWARREGESMLLGGALGVTRGTSTPGVRDHLRDEARRKALRSHVRVYLKSKRAATAFISRFNGSSSPRLP